MTDQTLRMEVSNVGGIESDTVSIEPGVTALSGENATNRTSLLKSLMAALGSDEPPIRAGTDEGYVQIDINGDSRERIVTSTQDGWYWDGAGVVDDIETLELFSFLLEENEVRRAVAAGDDLYDLVMRPVDDDEIKAEIADLKEQRNRIEEQEDSLDEKQDKIHRLKNTIEEKQAERDELKDELVEVEAKISEIDENEIQTEKIDQSKELNERLKNLSSKRTEIRNKVERLQSRIRTRESELEDLQSGEFADVDEIQEQIQEIKADIAEYEERENELDSDERSISPLKRFLSQMTNEDVSATEINRIVNKYGEGVESIDGDDSGSVTDALVEGGEATTCVLCGGEIDENHYQDMLAELNSIASTITSEKNTIRDELSSLRQKKSSLESKIDDVRSNKSRIDELETEIDEFEDDLAEAKDELDAVVEEYEEVEAEVSQLEEDAVEEAEDKTDQLRKLEGRKAELNIDIASLNEEISNHRSEIEELEDEVEAIQQKVSEEKPTIEDALSELKNRVENIESDIVERFNTQMDAIIDEMSYEGIERIWLEKKTRMVREGREKTEKTVFDLNVVREVDGKATGDVVDNLSESEREVTALIFALTGYIVHDVDEQFPIVIMDSVEMIDAGRLETLLEYMDQHVEYLVVATLPEDTNAMDIESVIEKEPAV